MATVKHKPGPAAESLKKALADLQSKKLRVGFFDTAKYEDGTPVAYVAAIQEFGYPGGSIPARPFFRPTIEQQRNAWRESLRKGSRAAMNGKLTIGNMYEQLGASAAGDVAKTIQFVTTPPLSPITLLLRQHKKSGRKVTGKTVGNAAAAAGFLPSEGAAEAVGVSGKPLVDTGYMISQVSHQVTSK